MSEAPPTSLTTPEHRGVAEYAEATGLNRSTVVRHCNDGTIRAIKVGPRTWRIHPSEFDRIAAFYAED